VREIPELTRATKIPKILTYGIGVIALRWTVAPILDVRLKFGLTESENTLGLRKTDRGLV
jgi:purine-binding chemotaxis protein CheW